MEFNGLETTVADLYRAGDTYDEIQTKTGATHGRINTIVRRLGLPRRPKAGCKRKRVRACANCGVVRRINARGLCCCCYYRLDVRRIHPPTQPNTREPEPTEAELEATIAEQMQCLPDWWERESMMMQQHEESG
jgi:hypothetical protein